MSSKSRTMRAVVFAIASAATLVSTQVLRAQHEVIEPLGCGLYSGPLCNVTETCMGIPGSDTHKCRKDYTYYRG